MGKSKAEEIHPIHTNEQFTPREDPTEKIIKLLEEMMSIEAPQSRIKKKEMKVKNLSQKTKVTFQVKNY